jgi:hypothetical protein
MKICWDNLEDIYITTNGYFRKGRNTYVEAICRKCEEECLIVKWRYDKNITDTCSHSCSKKDRPLTEQHKKNLREGIRKGFENGRVSSFKGKTHTRESKEKMRGPRPSVAGENNPRFGDHRTFEELHGKEKAGEMKKIQGEKWMGKNNPNIDGKTSLKYEGPGIANYDIASIRKVVYGRKLFYEWGKKVKERDKCCQHCGTEEKLEAHHMVEFKSIREYYDWQTWEEARNCELPFDIDIGITLCNKHHGAVTYNKMFREKYIMSVEEFMEKKAHKNAFASIRSITKAS